MDYDTKMKQLELIEVAEECECLGFDPILELRKIILWKERRTLLSKPYLWDTDKERIKEIEKKVHPMRDFSNKTPEEQEAMDIITKAAADHLKGKDKETK